MTTTTATTATFAFPATIPAELQNYFAAKAFAVKQGIVAVNAKIKKADLFNLLDNYFSAQAAKSAKSNEVRDWVAATAKPVNFISVKNHGRYLSANAAIKGVRYYVGQRDGNATVSIWFEGKTAKAAFERAAFCLSELSAATQVEIRREDESGAIVLRSYGQGLDTDWAVFALHNYTMTFENAF